MPPILQGPLLPVHPGLDVRPGPSAASGWQAVNDAYARSPSLDRADPPSRGLPVGRAADRRRAARRPRRADGRGLVGRARGHVRRAPVEDLARRRRGGGGSSTQASAGWAATASRCSTARMVPGRSSWRRPGDDELNASEFNRGAAAVLGELDGAGDVLPGADDEAWTVLLGSARRRRRRPAGSALGALAECVLRVRLVPSTRSCGSDKTRRSQRRA